MLLPDDKTRPEHEPPVTAEEIRRQAWEREPHEREAVPVPGERVLFRAADWAPGVPAAVVSVQDMTVPNDGWGGSEPDPHVWHVPPDPLAGRLRPDPWPWVTLKLEAGGGVTCREARVRGSAGWLRPGSRFHAGGG